MHWLSCFLDPSFRNFAFIPNVTTADKRFKRDLLNDVDQWLLAEMQPAATQIARKAAGEELMEQGVQLQLEAPAKKRRTDPFDELRTMQSTRDRPQTQDAQLHNEATVLQETCQHELSSYKSLRVTAACKNPLTFWNDNAADYPILAATSRRLYCISASSAQSERDFSSVGHSITDTRLQLSPANVEAIELVRWGMRNDMFH
ncbi:uncharacterized protein LOC136076221 [Hydra vulgaris]|uniref:Uncharacterized protein LOC136076221 n=1 Tax=Hydra vulgaris TaxID=6087 RepID=A0ABM4BA49_HYDVU